MRTRFHKLTAWVLTLAMLITFIPGFTLSVSAATTSGTTGDCAWSFDDTTGVFTVSGNGAMANVRFALQRPYYSYLTQIKSIVIEDGVTSIGNYAFYNCTNLQSLTIKGNLDKIGNYAFYSCSAVTSISYYGVNVPELGSSVGLDSLNITVSVPEDYAEGVDKFAGLEVSRTLPATGGEAQTPTYEVKMLRHTTDTGVAVKSVISDGVTADKATHGKDLKVFLEITGEGNVDEVYVRYIKIGTEQEYYFADADCPISLDAENLTLTVPGDLVDGTVEIDAGIMLDVVVNLEGGYLKDTTYGRRWSDADTSDDVAALAKDYAFYGYGGSWAWNECFARDGYILKEITSNLAQHGPYDPNKEVGPVLDQDMELTLVWESESASDTHTVSTSCNPTEGGTVSGGGEYEENESATVTAVVNEGYEFINWTKKGEEVSKDASYTFAVTEDCELVANFGEVSSETKINGVTVKINGIVQAAGEISIADSDEVTVIYYGENFELLKGAQQDYKYRVGGATGNLGYYGGFTVDTSVTPHTATRIFTGLNMRSGTVGYTNKGEMEMTVYTINSNSSTEEDVTAATIKGIKAYVNGIEQTGDDIVIDVASDVLTVEYYGENFDKLDSTYKYRVGMYSGTFGTTTSFTIDTENNTATKTFEGSYLSSANLNVIAYQNPDDTEQTVVYTINAEEYYAVPKITGVKVYVNDEEKPEGEVYAEDTDEVTIVFYGENFNKSMGTEYKYTVGAYSGPINNLVIDKTNHTATKVFTGSQINSSTKPISYTNKGEDTVVTGYVFKEPVITYSIFISKYAGYTVTKTADTSSPVAHGENYSFTVEINQGYEKTADFAVKAGNKEDDTASLVELTPDANGVYTLANITSDKKISVQGVSPCKPDSEDDFKEGGNYPFAFICEEDETHSLTAPYYDSEYITIGDINAASGRCSVSFNIKKYLEDKLPGHRTVASVSENSTFWLKWDEDACKWEYSNETREFNVTCAPLKYSIVINSAISKGTVAANVTEAEEGETITLTITPDEGYKLRSLSVTQTNGTSVTVENNEFIMPASDVRVHASFEGNKYTVIFFNKDGGEIIKRTVKHGEAATAPQAPQVEGYTFIGWDKSFDNVTTDLDVTAQYEINKYDALFYVDGNLIETVSTDYGAVPVAPKAPEKMGYKFIKWTPELAKIGINGARYDAVYEADDVQYKIETYTMDTKGIYGAAEVKNYKAKTGSEVSVTPDIMEGFTVDETKSVLKNTVAADGSTVLKIYYRRNQYNFKVTVDGTADEKTYYFAQTIEIPKAPEKEGYKFIKWSPEIPQSMPSENVEVTAVWQEKADITVETDVQTYTYDSTAKGFEVSANAKDGFDVRYSQNGNDIAKIVNAGTYDVIITRSEDADYKKFETTIIGGLVIAKKDISNATVGTFAQLTYSGKAQTPEAAVTVGNLTVTGNWSSVINVSDTTTFTASGNFEGEIKNKETGMLKADPVYTEPTAKTDLVYNGSEQELLNAGFAEGGTMKYYIGGIQATEEVSKGISAGKYSVSCIIDGGENYNNVFVGTYVAEIAKATPFQNPEKPTTAKVRNGRKLADATVSNGEFLAVDKAEALEGIFTWIDDSEIITEDTIKKMKFSPNDENYAEIEFDVSVDSYRTGGGSGGSTLRYNVTFETNSESRAEDAVVIPNGKIEEPKTPQKEGYIFSGWFEDEECTKAYDFESVVTKDITLYAKWDKQDDEEKTTNTHDCPSLEFDDLDVTAWYHTDTDYVIENGLFNGITENKFAPNGLITRAMMVTVLYRAENEPQVSGDATFEDVDKNAYYGKAVIWGQQNGIINGYSKTEFAPNQNITREQIAAIMHRYAKFKGKDVSAGENTNILSYSDFDEISEYAISSMQYAAGSGLMRGKTSSTLNPKDNATRAEIAAILHRFIEADK